MAEEKKIRLTLRNRVHASCDQAHNASFNTLLAQSLARVRAKKKQRRTESDLLPCFQYQAEKRSIESTRFPYSSRSRGLIGSCTHNCQHLVIPSPSGNRRETDGTLCQKGFFLSKQAIRNLRIPSESLSTRKPIHNLVHMPRSANPAAHRKRAPFITAH